MKISKIRVCSVKYRLMKPFVISFESFNSTEALIVVIETDEKIKGYGVAAPFKPITGDSTKEATQFIGTAIRSLIGWNPCDIEVIHEILTGLSRNIGFDSRCAEAAIDFACYDILGKNKRRGVYQLLGSSHPRIVPTTVTIGINTPEEMAKNALRLAKRFEKEGVSRLKLKIAGDPDIDKKRVLAVADVFPREFTLDANQSYNDPKMAVELFKELHNSLGNRIILIEEPCPKGELLKLKYVRENCEIPIYADESAATLKDTEKLIENKAVDGINIKLQKAGGIYWANKIANLAEANNIEVMVGCMHGEREIGIAAGTHFVAGTSNVANSDLDMDLLYPTNIVSENSRVQFKSAARIPHNKPGLGLELSNMMNDILNGAMHVRQILQK